MRPIISGTPIRCRAGFADSLSGVKVKTLPFGWSLKEELGLVSAAA
jgi:hypothetical protein